MHIFIDESGIFSLDNHKNHSLSTIGSLVIPNSSMKGFSKLYGRLRRGLPKINGEVKGRLLSEKQVFEVSSILKKVGCIFEISAIDMGLHTKEGLQFHRSRQMKKMTENLTSEHHPNVVKRIWELRHQLENMSLQLYVQSAAMSGLVYNTLFNADLYFALRIPSELGSYHWIIDAKEVSKMTPWEEWWSVVVLPMLESKTFRDPLPMIEGGNYRWHERFKTEPSEYKLQFIKKSQKSEFFDLKMVLTENRRFSSSPEFGLEAVDILTNTIRRSMAGNFERQGWLAIRQLMVHRKKHYIELISLEQMELSARDVPYMNVLNDFRIGGRSMLPKSYYSD